MTTTILDKLATLVRPGRHGLLVTDGHVYCSFSGGDVDLDRCLACSALIRFEEKDGQQSLRCRAIGGLHR